MTHFPISTPLGLGDLLDRVFRLYRVHAAKFLLAVAVFIVPMGLLSAFLVENTAANLFLVLRALQNDQTVQPTNQTGSWFFLLALLAFVVQGFVSLVSSQLAIDALHNRDLEVKRVLWVALRKFFPWLIMIILMALLMLMVAVVMMVVFALGGMILGVMFAAFASLSTPVFNGSPNPAVAVGLVIIFIAIYLGIILLFTSPFLYFYARWSVALPAMLDGNLGPTEAIRRSWNLTKFNVRRAIGYMILAYLLAFVILGTPTSALQLITGLAFPSENQWVLVGLFSAINVSANLLTSPISAIAYVLFYYELRVRKESYDLEMALQ